MLFRFPAGKRDFSVLQIIPTLSGANPPLTPILNGHRVLFSQGNEAWRGTDQTPRSIDEINTECRAQKQLYPYLTLDTF
jgi:hypothetical protein